MAAGVDEDKTMGRCKEKSGFGEKGSGDPAVER